MFRAVNTETEKERRRAAHEKRKIKEAYENALRTLSIQKFFDLKIVFEQNRPLYSTGRMNLLYNVVKKAPIESIESLTSKYDISESKLAFFEMIRKYLESDEFMKARMLLNQARQNGWWCNDLFDLEKDLKEKYFGGVKIFEKIKFDDIAH